MHSNLFHLEETYIWVFASQYSSRLFSLVWPSVSTSILCATPQIDLTGSLRALQTFDLDDTAFLHFNAFARFVVPLYHHLLAI
jgi:hypothetical protein